MAKPAQELLFAPLGGVGEIGMNLALYGLRVGNNREWLCVDMGVSFGDEATPGIDLIMADIAFAEEERRDIKGIVLTHGHEDHVGALFDLCPAQLRARSLALGLQRTPQPITLGMRCALAGPSGQAVEPAVDVGVARFSRHGSVR